MHQVFSCGAAGYYSVGNAVVRAETAEEAVELCNAATDSMYELTYYAHNAVSVAVVSNEQSEILTHREYGQPHLPAKGSGIKVTF